MTAIEAYDHVMIAITKLEASGVRVKRTQNATEEDFEMAAEYHSHGHLPPDRWLHVELRAETDQEDQLIDAARRRLEWIGVLFDTSINRKDCTREWCLDRSLGCVGASD
jgi:hypothetical protein